jgi:hypothetical protein
MKTEYAACLGIDWADKKHDLCLLDAATGKKTTDGQRQKPPAAVRALAYKWIRIIWKCWQTRSPYNEVRYIENLRKKGSPL